MKILFIHNQYVYKGGEDTVFNAEHNLLKQYGHDVQTLVFDNKNLVTTQDKVLAGVMTLFNTHSAKLLREKILDFHPDVIHVHNFFPIASPSMFFVARKAKVPIIMTLHNYRLICPSALLYRDDSICELCVSRKFALDGVIHGCYRQSKLQTLLLAMMNFIHNQIQTWQTKITRFIALTHFGKEKFLQSSLNLNDDQLRVKPNFVEDHGYSVDKKEYFLYIGRLSEEKGIDVVLKAFENSNKQLYLLGTGPLEDQIQESIFKHDNIKYLGFQSREEIIQQLKYAKALVFPSVWQETFGMTIIEAFSTATPVICTNIGAPAEIVKHGMNGLHFKTGDVEDLNAKVDWIYNHPQEYKTMCANARNEYETKYTAEKNYEMLINIYEEVLLEKK